MFEDVRFVSAGRFVSKEPWIHTRRTVGSHELIFVLFGQLQIAVDGQPLAAKAGEMIHIPAGVLHEGTGKTTAPISFYWVHFIGEIPQMPLFFHQHEPARTELLCRQLMHCTETIGYPRDCADYFVRLMLMELMVQQGTSSETTNVLCASVEEWVRGNCDHPIKVSELAEYFNFNPDYLNRVFRRYHPEGLKTYINNVRLQQIRKELVSTDLTLQEIARKYGFQDYKYFLKYFRFHEGVTPTEFRNAYYKTHVNWK